MDNGFESSAQLILRAINYRASSSQRRRWTCGSRTRLLWLLSCCAVAPIQLSRFQVIQGPWYLGREKLKREIYQQCLACKCTKTAQYTNHMRAASNRSQCLEDLEKNIALARMSHDHHALISTAMITLSNINTPLGNTQY